MTSGGAPFDRLTAGSEPARQKRRKRVAAIGFVRQPVKWGKSEMAGGWAEECASYDPRVYYTTRVKRNRGKSQGIAGFLW
jgi:hypothetical protein